MLEKWKEVLRSWEPLLKRIQEIHTKFKTGESKCNIVLLTGADFFGEFEKNFIEPNFEVSHFTIITAKGLARDADNIKEVIFLDFPGVERLYRKSESLKDFLEIAKSKKKFLIFCIYDAFIPNLKRSLKRAYETTVPEIVELRLEIPE